MACPSASVFQCKCLTFGILETKQWGVGVYCLFPLEKVMGKVRQKLGKKERKCFVSVPRFTQEGITTKKFNEI